MPSHYQEGPADSADSYHGQGCTRGLAGFEVSYEQPSFLRCGVTSGDRQHRLGGAAVVWRGFRKPKSVVLEVCDVTEDYNRAFDEVILPQWSKTSEKQRNAAGFSNRRGQLASNDPESYALHDTYSYQRGHADVFREVYKKAPHASPRNGERLLVVDIGAGAATVAVALGEALGRRQRQRVDYLAFDPNPTMRKLGRRILKHLNAGFNSADYIKSLEDVDFTDTDRLLFSLSYVVHQKAVAPAHIEGWARVIKRAVIEVDRPVKLIYTTAANFEGGAHIHLMRMLKEANIHRKPRPIGVQVRRRFPKSVSSDDRILWEEQRSVWDVEAEHWILSA